jgi:hypothetical protein
VLAWLAPRTFDEDRVLDTAMRAFWANAGRDPEIARLLDRDLVRRLDSFQSVIEAGRREGDITSTRDPDSLARFLNAVIAGIRVSAQGGADRAAL